MKHITIKDVAKKLNLSISTISRAFNDKYDIHPNTKELILKTANEMGYSPNPMAQRLTLNKSYVIGVIVPEFINDFFPKAIKGMQRVIKEAGYQMLIMSSNEQVKEELENVKILERNMVDGIIISLTQETRDITYYQKVIENIPMVQFNRVSQKLETPKVIFDDYSWSMFVTEHLISQGYKNIYHFSGPENLIITQNRKKGFIDALKKHKICHSTKNIIETGIFIEDGRRIMHELLEKKIELPDAIFCFNDPLAIGAIEELKDNGFKVPKDIAFVGFTESLIAMHMSPTLTSVEQPTEEIGETAARLLLKQIKDNIPTMPQTIILNGKINVRESSLKI
jgi:DNA-binding LacI/PurR family transcriptional regulator